MPTVRQRTDPRRVSARMGAGGLVDRDGCAEDRPAPCTHLTGEGRRVVVRALREHTPTIRRILFDPLSTDQQTRFLDILHRISDAIAVDVPPPPTGRPTAKG